MARQKRKSGPGPVLSAAPPATLPEFAVPSTPFPQPKQVSKEDVLAAFRSFGKGFDAETEGRLSVPDKLFMLQTDDARFYSKDEDFRIGEVFMALRSGTPIRLDTEYGICLYSTASTTYLLLADKSRRIVVRERLVCLHEKPSEDDWAAFKHAVDEALSLASKEKNAVAVYDGYLRAVKMNI